MKSMVLMGGEYNLIDRLSMSMMLNCSLFILSFKVIGKNMGVKISMVGVIFKNVLIMISNRLIKRRISNGLLFIDNSVLFKVCGMFLNDNS